MATQYVPLTAITPNKGIKIAPTRHLPEIIYIDDPAIGVMIDFEQEELLQARPDEPIDVLIKEIQACHAHECLIVDNDILLGIVNVRDLQGAKPMQICQEKQLQRHDITANLIMTPVSDILALQYDEIISARVGNVIVTLNHHKKQYAIVIEERNKQQSIRGLIVATKISEQLGQDIHNIHAD